jgi:hypothetical protein
MNLFRFTLVDASGGISFVAHADALSALLAACAQEPLTVEEMLVHVETYYQNLGDKVRNGLAVFDERNAPCSYTAIHDALDLCLPQEQPVFRIVDERTREESLHPVKAGGIIFNLFAKRIVQIQNTYCKIGRDGRGRVFDGERMTAMTYRYHLPKEWQLVP